MKLHLPLSLLSAVLLVAAGLTSRAQAVEVPSNYTPHYLADPDDLYDYRATSGNHAFLLDGSITFTPSSATWWTSSQELKENGSILFTIEEDSALYSLTFKGGANKVFYNVSTLAIEDIDRVTFEGLKESDYDYSYYSYSSSYPSYYYYYYGGAIHATTLRLKGNSRVTFTGNEVDGNSSYNYHYVYGGAIYGADGATITISETSGAVTFAQNKATSSSSSNSSSDSYDSYSYGGAIYGGRSSTISISSNTGDVNITENTASDSSSSSDSSASGGAIYGGNSSTISISSNTGDVNITENTASSFSSFSDSSGGAIYGGDSSTISISSNTGDVNIAENTASSFDSSGGAIYGGSSSTISISSNTGDVNITENTAYDYGGAIYGAGDSTISICDNEGDVSFTGNSSSRGGAIYGGSSSTISISGNAGAVNITENTAYDYGGAIYGGSSSTISISGNAGAVNITGNSSSDSNHSSYGGAIYGGGSISISGNAGAVNITGNSSSSNNSSYGGAIYGRSISICDNESDVSFTGNSSSYGGAIYGGGSISISGNAGAVNITGNSSSRGGAIYGGGSISFSGNAGAVNITGNSSSAYNSSYGGAIYGESFSTISICGNTGDINITDNSSSASSYNSSYGGAIYGGNYSTISICDNEGDVSFTGNSSDSSDSSDSDSDSSGGAIYGGKSSTISISGNAGAVNITENTASSDSSDSDSDSSGGAIYGGKSSTISISGNAGAVNITGNSSSAYYDSYGGAIYGADYSTISICDNEGDVSFTGNSSDSAAASALGGAIYSEGSLYLQNNGNTLIAGNYEKEGSNYRLRSIYMSSTASEGWHFHLSAAAGKNIEFRDSVYIGSGSTVELNADYTTSEGKVIKQEGDIFFTGAYTEAHLMEMKGGIAGTAEEILASRTSEVYARTNLYGGRLRVEDDAIYKGRGITVHEGSAATLMLKNGELNHAGYNITICSGSTLSALGESTLTALDLIIQDGGTMQLALDMSQTDSAAVLTTTGYLSMRNISFNLTGTEYLVKGDYKLLTRTEGTDYDISGWTLNGVTSEQLRWENGTLYYTGGHNWNHGVTDDDDISAWEEILGNLIINGGDVTLEAVVGAIQDAVDAGFGHGQGHIVINRGGIHISGAGDLDGHIIFNGNLKDIRKLFIEKDITGITIELGGNSQAENIVDVGDRHTMEIDSLSGEGGMNKTGKGEMVVHGNGHKVGGTLSVQEGTLTFTVANATSGEAETEVHELVVGDKKDKEAKVKVDKDTKVKGHKMRVDGRHAVVTNNGTMEFTEEVKVKNGHLDNRGSISKVTLEGGKVSGSGTFAGLEMLGGELVVGNSPGLQTYTDDVEFTEGMVTFSLADTETAATADTHGWGAAAYSTIDMGGNALTLGENVNFVLEIGGAALESLIAADDASLTFSLSLIQNIGAESLTLDSNALAALLGNTIIMITSDAEGLSTATLYLAGRDITALLSDGSYGYEGNTLVFKGTVTNDGSLTIPEPTTATLSLLALAGLAARRRRK